MNAKGITLRPVAFKVKEVIDRLQSFLQAHGATVYARIDQQAELHKAGMDIRPLEFILFGNPKAGGKIIMENPVAALDLPLKVIAWEDEQQQVWIAYNEAVYIAERHALKADPGSPLSLDKLIDNALNI